MLRRDLRTAADRQDFVDSYHVVNATLSSENLIPDTGVSFSVYNLFDASQDMLDVIPMNGRSVVLRLLKTF